MTGPSLKLEIIGIAGTRGKQTKVFDFPEPKLSEIKDLIVRISRKWRE